MKPPRYTLTIVIPHKAKPAQVEPILRLRQWLKIGLRGFGIRCVSIEETTKPQPAPADPEKPGGSLPGGGG